MRVRDVYLLNGQSLNDSDTVMVNLTRGLKILFIRLQYTATNGATSNTLQALNSMVSKLQVIDGSSVLYSLSMREAQALNFFDNRRMPFQQLSQAAAGVVTEEAIIDFRRFDGDTGFYLDTSKYQNPQLSLTHALTISATAGFATGTGKLTAIARVIDSGAPSNLGFRMAKEIDSFASAASGVHTTQLPLDWPISALLISNPVNAKTPDNSLSNFELTADVDSYIPVNEAYLDLVRRNYNQYGVGFQKVHVLNGTAYTVDGDLYYGTVAAFGPAGATAKAIVTTLTANEAAGVGTTGDTGEVDLALFGSAPHSSVYYPIGDGYSSDQIFTPQGVGRFELKLTNAATGATPKVVVVQQHP